jgi:hypothetical protein
MRQSFFPRAFLTSPMPMDAIGAVPLTHAVTARRPYILVRSPDRCMVWAWPIVPSLLMEVAIDESQTGLPNPLVQSLQPPPA